ncbi:MAG: tryptophan-rich sensory protein [Muribaculaceae bacterium]|nr:tryptophan-rich sensory protein [Muribaculaceae bacterium]
MKKFLQFIFAMVVSFIPGLIGIMFTPMGHSDAWFNSLNQSVLTPAPWVFAVAWTVLYALLGIALFMIINARSRYSKAKSYLLFVTQMALNALWSYAFFGLHMADLGMIVVVLLFIFTIWMKKSFYPISRGASALVWPYLIWLVLAGYLNAMVLYLN